MGCRALHCSVVHCSAAKLPYRKTLIQLTGRRKIHLSTVFAGQYVGIREIADEVSLANSHFKPLLVAETDLDNIFSVGSSSG